MTRARPHVGQARRGRQAARGVITIWAIMTDDVASRRRRATFRAGHRGTKEMDWLLGRYADAHVPGMPVQQLEEFERLLEMPDPLLQDMIVYPEIAPAGDFVELVRRLRTFHGLE